MELGDVKKPMFYPKLTENYQSSLNFMISNFSIKLTDFNNQILELMYKGRDVLTNLDKKRQEIMLFQEAVNFEFSL